MICLKDHNLSVDDIRLGLRNEISLNMSTVQEEIEYLVTDKLRECNALVSQLDLQIKHTNAANRMNMISVLKNTFKNSGYQTFSADGNTIKNENFHGFSSLSKFAEELKNMLFPDIDFGNAQIESFVDFWKAASKSDDALFGLNQHSASATTFYEENVGQGSNKMVLTGVSTARPTGTPTPKPSATPTLTPTARPTGTPTPKPSAKPTLAPTAKPTSSPTLLSSMNSTYIDNLKRRVNAIQDGGYEFDWARDRFLAAINSTEQAAFDSAMAVANYEDKKAASDAAKLKSDAAKSDAEVAQKEAVAKRAAAQAAREEGAAEAAAEEEAAVTAEASA